jgi:hypothetical protein
MIGNPELVYFCSASGITADKSAWHHVFSQQQRPRRIKGVIAVSRY